MKYAAPNITDVKGIEPRGWCTDGHTCKSFRCESGSFHCDSKFNCTSHSTR